MSLWASVPHYVAAAPCPKAALALVRRLEELVGVSVDLSELEDAAANYERQVGLAVSSNPEVQAFVERLEQDAESDGDEGDEESESWGAEWGPLSPDDLPSGERLASEFQRFLRQQGIRSRRSKGRRRGQEPGRRSAGCPGGSASTPRQPWKPEKGRRGGWWAAPPTEGGEGPTPAGEV